MNDGEEGQRESSAFEPQASLARQAGDNWDPLVSTTSGQDPHSGTSESSTWYGVLV